MQRTQPTSRSNEHTSLLLDHSQIVLNLILTLAGADGLAHLASDELAESLRKVLHRVSAQLRHNVAGNGEQIIACQDGDRVVPSLIRRLRAATLIRLIHHIVVIQRRQVGQLHHRSRFKHLLRARILTIMGGKQRKHHTEALATSVEKVADLVGKERFANR